MLVNQRAIAASANTAHRHAHLTLGRLKSGLLIFVVVFVRTIARDRELMGHFPVVPIFLGVFGAIFDKAFEGALRMFVHGTNRGDQARL